jgi:hypothetical protein
MNIDMNLVNQILSKIHYPISKAKIVEEAQKHNVSPQVMGVLQQLPDKQYNSQQELENQLKSVAGKMP